MRPVLEKSSAKCKLRITSSFLALNQGCLCFQNNPASQDHHGADSIKRCNLTSIGNRIVEIRRSYDRLISTMGFPILVRRHLYIDSGPRWYYILSVVWICHCWDKVDMVFISLQYCTHHIWYQTLHITLMAMSTSMWTHLRTGNNNRATN